MSDEAYVNPLTAPPRYELPVLLRELKFGRPANSQHLLESMAELTESGRWLLDIDFKIIGVVKPEDAPSRLAPAPEADGHGIGS